MNFIRFAQLLLVITTLLSGWLTYESISASIGCGAGGDCSSVITSPWAKLMGVPVALLGLFTYLSLLVLTSCRPFQSRATAVASTTICLIIVGSALWFTALQAIIIKSFCPYCCAIHLLASIAGIILLIQIFSRYEGAVPLPITSPLVLSCLIIAGMVATQFITPVPTRAVTISTEHHKHGADTPPLLFSINHTGAPVFQSATSPSDSLETLHLGSKAGKVIQLGYLYDWTCDYCIALHQLLSETASADTALSYQYQITLLPYSHTEKGIKIHQHLASMKKTDPTNYEIIELELHHQILEPDAEKILNRIQELSPNLALSEMNPTHLEIAHKQLLHNQATLHLNTVPQLFGISSALSGKPTKEELFTFLEKVANEQAQYTAKQ